MALNETMRRLQVSISFEKGNRQRSVRLEIMDDVSGQTVAAFVLDPAQFTNLMGSQVLLIHGHTSKVVSRALADAQDC